MSTAPTVNQRSEAESRFGLTRELWLVQIGIGLNALGWGAVLPFEVIYLHDGRGFSVGVAGLVVGTLTGIGVVSAPLSGPLIDRFGARACAAAAGVALAAGYAWLAFARTPATALAAAAIAGAGNGALNPSQSALLAALAAPAVRHRVTAVSRVVTNAGFAVGGGAGGLVAAGGLRGLQALFLINSITYIVYVIVLLLVVRAQAQAPRIQGGYRTVLRDRVFVHLALTNIVIIAVGWGAASWLVPTYARNGLAISPQLIGLLAFANATTVVGAQVPIARLTEGRHRGPVMAAGASTIAGAFALIAAARFAGHDAYPLLLVAMVAIALGECLHTSALMPLVADLAPPNIRGRYMATMGLSWWIGLALAPSVGSRMLGVSGPLTFAVCSAAAAAAAVSMLALDRRLPAAARITPAPPTPTPRERVGA